MERNEYKYIKYKNKYTNTLKNMFGGVPSLNVTLQNAFNEQSKAIFIVDEETNNKVRILLSLGENETNKTINKYTDCIDMLIGISNKDVLKIIPMVIINEFINSCSNVPNDRCTGYTNGLQKINGDKAKFFKGKEIQFTRYKDNLSNLYFGKHPQTSLYSSETAKKHLLSAKEYFNLCGFTNPYIIILSHDNTLHFYGTLYA